MKEKLAALLMILLLLPVPSALAAEDVQFEDEQTEEELLAYPDVMIVADYYEPSVITSSVLEEQAAPVYIILRGIKLNPLIENVEVRDINARITSVKSEPPVSDPRRFLKTKSVVKWVRPRNPTLENPGYLELRLNPLITEHANPEDIISFMLQI